MYAKDLVIDDNGQSEEVEHVGEVVPHICVAIFARAFRVEAVRLGDTARLMVAADEVDAVRVAQLQADEEGDGLNGEESAVDIIACRELAKQFGSRAMGPSLRASSIPRNR